MNLMYQDKDGVLDGIMHVNPNHIVSVFMREDDKVGYMLLDAHDFRIDPYYGTKSSVSRYEITKESYERIVAWMERHDV